MYTCGHLDASKRCETIGLSLGSLVDAEDQPVGFRSGCVRCSVFRIVDSRLTHWHVSQTKGGQVHAWEG